MKRSLVLRSDGVIAYPVRVGVIRGIDARVRSVILVYSSCQRVKGSGLLSRAVSSIGMRRRRSSRSGFIVPIEPLDLLEPLDPEEARETLLVDPWPDEEGLYVLAGRKSAPEFFKVFTMSA